MGLFKPNQLVDPAQLKPIWTFPCLGWFSPSHHRAQLGLQTLLLLAFYEDFLSQFTTPILTQFANISLALQSFYLKLDLYV